MLYDYDSPRSNDSRHLGKVPYDETMSRFGVGIVGAKTQVP